MRRLMQRIKKSVLQSIHKVLATDCRIQGVSEIGAIILTANRTHQKEQLFSLSFLRKTLGNGLKN
jgi:hypothetical protein